MSLLSWNEYLENRTNRPLIAESVDATIDPEIVEKLVENHDKNEKKWAKLNEATAQDLQKIKGIGPKTAAKVIELQPFDSAMWNEEHLRDSLTKKQADAVLAWAETN